MPDLLVYAGDHLLLYAGDAKGSRPLSGKPAWSVAVSGAPKKEKGGGGGELEDVPTAPNLERFLYTVELPGGGRAALARGAQKDGRSVLTVVFRK